MNTKILRLDNLHILFWLIKDMSWMFEYKWVGVAMIFPTILVAVIICYTYRKHNLFLAQLAVLFWILANANWMLDDFFSLGFKNFSGILFLLGLTSIGLYYLHFLLKKIK